MTGSDPSPRFLTVRLDSSAHDRDGFCSGTEPLDRYLKAQASQDVKRRLSQCFVALEEGRIAGYYTLSATSIPLDRLPLDLAKRLPRYPSIPAIRMGRLAVDQAFRGRGLGGELLADALARAAGAEVGAYAMVVDAKDDQATGFYRHHGFIPFEDAPWTLFLPLGGLPKA